MSTTDIAAQRWRDRDRIPSAKRGLIGTKWVKRYWDDVDAPVRREILLRAVREIGSIDSALEVGSNAGPNLRLLHREYPHADLVGIDINKMAVKHGKQWAKREGWDLNAWHGDMRSWLPSCPCDLVDFVLSWYALSYIDTPDIEDVLKDMVRVARKGVLIVEPMVSRRYPLAEIIPNVQTEWRHDYWRRLSILISPHVGTMVCWPIFPEVDRMNGAILLKKVPT